MNFFKKLSLVTYGANRKSLLLTINLLCEAAEPLLNLRKENITANLWAHLTGSNDLSVAKALHDSSSLLNLLLVITRKKNLSTLLSFIPPITTYLLPAVTAWISFQVNIDISLSTITKSSPQNLVATAYRELQFKYTDQAIFFTDASKSGLYTGCTIYRKKQTFNTIIYFVFLAELFCIKKGVEITSSMYPKILICTDYL